MKPSLINHLKEELRWYLDHPFYCLMYIIYISALSFIVVDHFSKS
jgi:hypothetical protein